MPPFVPFLEDKILTLVSVYNQIILHVVGENDFLQLIQPINYERCLELKNENIVSMILQNTKTQLYLNSTILIKLHFYRFYSTWRFGQTIFSIHEIYFDTLVYTTYAFLALQVFADIPKDMIPYCVYIFGLSLFFTWSGPPVSPYKMRCIFIAYLYTSNNYFQV